MLSYGALPLSFEEDERHHRHRRARRRAAEGRSDRRRHRPGPGRHLPGGLLPRPVARSPSLSLLVSAILTYTIMSLLGPAIGFALNLPAVCGAIVAIGITADSFIVYFERIRDEIREGRTLRPAVERAWPRARRTILVSDFVSFLAAAVLFIVTVGKVQGFAFTLGLTTLLDVVVVFLFTKPLMTLLARTKFFAQRPPVVRPRPEAPRRQAAAAPHPSPSARPRPTRRRREMSQLGNLGARLYRGEVGYDFVGKRKIWYGVSILITITAIVGLAVRGLNMGIEFQGGAVFTTPKTSVSVCQAAEVRGGGLRPRRDRPEARQRRRCGSRSPSVDTGQADQIKDAARQGPRVAADKINADLVGPSWGEQIANKAWHGPGDLHGPRGDLSGHRLRVAHGGRRARSR